MKQLQFQVSFFLVNQFIVSICHPIFSFDLFGTAVSTTTQESVISDYRHQKKTDSSFDHINLLKNGTIEEVPMYSENTAEFYAEVFGRLIGSVRNSFSDLIGDIKKRRQYFRERNDPQYANQQSNKTIDEMALEAMLKQLDERLYGTSKNLTIEEIEPMSKKSKRNPLIDTSDTQKVGLTIPINLNPFDYDLISEEGLSGNFNTENGFNGDTDGKDETHWLRKYYEFFEQLKENHHSKKEKKIMNLFKLILTPVLKLNMSRMADESFDNEIMFNIIQGNRTIALLTPFQILKIIHKESNDRIQLRMKLILKRIVYKYARLYYIARKNYKNSHGYYQDLQNEDNNFRLLDESLVSDNEVDNTDEFLTNDGSRRLNLQSLEGIAIFALEIFGALFALTIGLWAQIEGSFDDFLE